jgi:hypothetical protein
MFPGLLCVAAAGKTDEPPLVAALVCVLLGAALLRCSRGIGNLLGSFYRGPGLPQSREPEPARADVADLVASFWTWGFRVFGAMFAGFAVYIVVAQFI